MALVLLLAAIAWLLGTIDPVIDDARFFGAMALLGLGMGLLASQLGNVVQSSVGERERSEVGGLQSTAQVRSAPWDRRGGQGHGGGRARRSGWGHGGRAHACGPPPGHRGPTPPEAGSAGP